MTKDFKLSHLLILGTLYGLAWGLVALGILGLMGMSLTEILRSAPSYLLASVPTGIGVTWLLKRFLSQTRSWILIPYGFLALLLGTLVFAACMFFIWSGQNFVDNLAYRSAWEAFTTIHTHDSLIMFIWYPYYAFAFIFPIFLAILNCWDLRRRLTANSAAAV